MGKIKNVMCLMLATSKGWGYSSHPYSSLLEDLFYLLVGQVPIFAFSYIFLKVFIE